MDSLPFSKQKTLAIIAGCLLILVVIVGAVQYRHSSTNAMQTFIANQKMPYAALTPDYLPTESRFQSDQGTSAYDSSTGTLTLRWVFPAQTLPGQGTLLLYQYESSNISHRSLPTLKNTKYVEFDTTYGRSEGDLGEVMRGEVPNSPGQRALSTRIHDRTVVLVSYALSDNTLLKIASSLH